MCQEDVKGFLFESPKEWFTVREISEGTGISLNSASDNCKMLRKRNQVYFRTENRLIGRCYKDVIVYRYKHL